MLIIGTGGLAKQLLESLGGSAVSFCFYDDINGRKDFQDKFQVLTSLQEARTYFLEKDLRFILAVGNPKNRHELANKFTGIGGSLTTLISDSAYVSGYDVTVAEGATIMGGTYIEPGVRIGRGALININSTITHDTIIGEFSEIGPGVTIAGACNIGSFCSIGACAVVIPKISIGNNVIIGAGSVVIRAVPDNVMVAGNPAQIKKYIK
jgi:sugar O-acyltransferase (sialic acid O-acetyltransferase NeuD family)